MSCEPTNVYDICIFQNQTYRLPMLLVNRDGQPIDLSSWTFSASIKDRVGNDADPVLNFTSSLFPANSGWVSFYLSADTTWALNKTRYTYDIIGTDNFISPPETVRLLQGKIFLKNGVTEP